MESFLQKPQKEKGSNKILIIALVAGLIVVGAVIGLLALRPSMNDVQQSYIEGAFREGSPEFAAYTKRISISTDEDRTMYSPTAMGTVMMVIGGNVRNSSDKTITGLEIETSVVDQFAKVLKSKTLIVVPTQVAMLEPNQTIPVQVRIEGFDPKEIRADIHWKVTAIKVQ
jgi:hypothetical protein